MCCFFGLGRPASQEVRHSVRMSGIVSVKDKGVASLTFMISLMVKMSVCANLEWNSGCSIFEQKG